VPIITANIFKRHLIKIAFFLSILFHLLFFLIGNIRLFSRDITELLKQPPRPDKRLVFELVETPESARSESPPENARLLSDKNAVARDNYQQKDKPAGNPYSAGDLDVKNLPVIPAMPINNSVAGSC